MTRTTPTRFQYCNDEHKLTGLDLEQERVAKILWRAGLPHSKIVAELQNAYGLDETAIAAIEGLLHQLGSEIYTQQLQLITELNKTGTTGYKIAAELKKRFGAHALSQKSVYNELARSLHGEPCDRRLGLAAFQGARKRKTRHR